MQKLIYILKLSIKPVLQKHWFADLSFAIPRFFCGMLMSLNFGASKFGVPWTDEEKNLDLFEVSAWFPSDVAEFGGIFALFPVFFAWMAAASETIGGVFLAFGFKTRISSFLILCTMLVAIFLQQWSGGVWSMLPALGFLWVSIYHLFLGSGRFGLDYLIHMAWTRATIETPLAELK